MTSFKLVDSINSKAQIRHIKACNWYARGVARKIELDKHWKREYNNKCKLIDVIRKWLS